MSGPAVKVEGLGKRYRLGERAASYRTLREALVGRLKRPAARQGRELWAVRDVSFEVAQGEAIGIIGRNGAGKSTLLKMLSRVTEPTCGRALIRGRVGSLLEVGTGFHPELTGRENIFLNGAILGMARTDIRRRFDDIVAFAELEQFLDTPVKRYSSGMYMRLAFSVAAHLEPEVLVVDEVLAVGDLEFQKKCLGKMGEVAGEGRTVFFVSHNLPTVARLCSRAILMSAGRIVDEGPAGRVVGAYLTSELGTSAHREWPDSETAPGDEIVRLRRIRIRTHDGRTAQEVDICEPVGVEVEFDVLREGAVLVPNLHFYANDGTYAFVSVDTDDAWRRKPRPAGRYTSAAWIPGNLLSEGSLIVGAALTTLNPLHIHCYERDAVSFTVVEAMGGDTARGDYGGPMPGAVRPYLRWTTAFTPAPPGVPI